MGQIAARLCPKQPDNSYTSNHYFREWKLTQEHRGSAQELQSSYSSGSGPFSKVSAWRSAEDIKSMYTLGQLTGTGGFAKVLLAHPVLAEASSNQSVVKTIRKSDHLTDSYAMREAEILRQLDHPHIVKFQEIYEDREAFHIVLEYLKGGTLLDYLLPADTRVTNDSTLHTEQHTSEDRLITEGRKLNSETALFLVWQILTAVAYLHKNSIVHGDLKPENFVFEELRNSGEPLPSDAHVKLIDFGLAEIFSKNRKLSAFSGSRHFLAPEVLSSSYNEKRDIWSIGVLLYVMVAGTFPFFGNSEVELFEAIQQGRYPLEPIKAASPEVKELIANMLSLNPDARWSASGYLEQPSLSRYKQQLIQKSTARFTSQDLDRMKRTKSDSLTKSEVSKIILMMTDEWQPTEQALLRRARETFLSLDSDYSGQINFEKLELFLRGISADPESDTDLILQHSHRHSLSYTEWVTHFMPSEVIFEETKLWRAFKWMDVDSDGLINITDLQMVLARTGRRFTRTQLEQMISEVDTNNDRRWSWTEFRQHFESQD